MRAVESANEGFAAIAQRVHAGMVRVVSSGRGAGAGTVLHPEGLVLTNAHVASTSNLYVDCANGDRHPAHVLAVDNHLDLAALSVEASGFQSIELGSTQEMRPGELVFAMGYPWGVEGGFTAGVLIGVGTWWPQRGGRDRDWVMASLHLRPGHSGGPLVDVGGKLIGINTIMRGPDVGVAIPIETAAKFLRASLGRPKMAA